MQTFDVHLYPVARVKFSGVSAETHELAAASAAEQFRAAPDRHMRNCEYADEMQSALVDVVGDEDHVKTREVTLGTGEMLLRVSRREFNTMLASLRFWQRAGNTGDEDEYTIANNTGEDTDRDDALSDVEIDALCERMNCS